MCYSHRNSQDGIGSKTTFVVRTVELNEFSVEADLIGTIESLKSIENLTVYIGNCFSNPFPLEACLITVTQFGRLINAG